MKLITGGTVRYLAAVLVMGLLTASPLRAQDRADSTGIRQAALDYIEGWYSVDSTRMARALHPELVKRILNSDRQGRSWIGNQGASQLIRGTANGGGRETPEANRKTEVRILDIFQKAAVARIDAGPWIDYLQLVKWQGRWVILNVLWENRTPSP
jgi:hypothetical protein